MCASACIYERVRECRVSRPTHGRPPGVLALVCQSLALSLWVVIKVQCGPSSMPMGFLLRQPAAGSKPVLVGIPEAHTAQALHSPASGAGAPLHGCSLAMHSTARGAGWHLLLPSRAMHVPPSLHSDDSGLNKRQPPSSGSCPALRVPKQQGPLRPRCMPQAAPSPSIQGNCTPPLLSTTGSRQLGASSSAGIVAGNLQ